MSDRLPGEPERGGATGSGDVAPVADTPLKTVPIRPEHRTADFRCGNSPRVQGFFSREMPRYTALGYCRVLILPDPADPTGIWGYYTLSPGQIEPIGLTSTQRRQAINGIPVPLMRVGFMGRDDRAPKGLGEALLVDAARRVYRSEDTAAWGLILDAEGGSANPKLFGWYRDTMKFTPIRDAGGGETGELYCPLRRLLPELQRGS